VLSADQLHSIGNATPYEGFEITGIPVRTMVRGKTVAKDGQPVGERVGAAMSRKRRSFVPRRCPVC